MRNRPVSASRAVAAANFLGRNPRIDHEEPGDRAGRQVREHRGHRLFATGPKADPLDQADPHPSDPHDPGGGRHEGAFPRCDA